jgi:hypothetical protein
VVGQRVERGDRRDDQQQATGGESCNAPARGATPADKEGVTAGQRDDRERRLEVKRPGVWVRTDDRATLDVPRGRSSVAEHWISTPCARVRFPPPALSSSDASGKLSSVKTAERKAARRLRRLGWSVKEIERHLGVSRSSVSLWVRDVKLSEKQIAELNRRSATSPGQLAGAAANAALGRKRRMGYQLAGRTRAQLNDRLHLAGCMLYWAEGDKRRQGVRVANSDPEVLCLFVRFLRECYGAPIDRIAVTCNLFADHLERQQEIEQFWLDTLGLPRTCLRSSIVNVYSKYSQKKRKNKLPYGTCKVVYNDTRTVQSIYGAIQEYAGFDRPGWLD